MKKHLLLSILFALFFVSKSTAQITCLPDGITFSSQAQVDSFAILYPDCEVIGGNVRISGEDIVDLTGLSSLTSIQGNFGVTENDNLETLSGLENLETIGGNLVIGNIFQHISPVLLGNPILTELSFHNLSTIAGSLIVMDNASLHGLEGMHSLQSIGGSLEIHANPNLLDLSGLVNLEEIGEDCSIGGATFTVGFNGGYVQFGNGSLSNLGLNALAAIGGNFQLAKSNLTDLTGLNNLESIGGGMSIVDNPALTSFNGLDLLDSISWLQLTQWHGTSLEDFHISTINSLYISDCDSLTNLTDFEQVTFPIPGTFSFVDCENLYSLEGLNITQDSISGSLVIGNNQVLADLQNLNSLERIGENCSIALSPELTDLEVLSNLRSVGDNFQIWGNPSLTSLQGLENLEEAGSFEVRGNSSMNSLAGINKLKSVGSLTVIGNSALFDLTGLDNLERIDYLTIAANENLESLDGLSIEDSIPELTLGYYDGYDGPFGNPSLTDLSALSSITYIGSLSISFNESLESLDGLDNITTIGSLSLWANDSLASLIALENLDYTTIEFLRINENSNLSVCDIQPICGYLENGGDAEIFNNASGCNSQEEVEDACAFVSAEEEISENNNLQVFPNPATGFLNIQLPEDIVPPIVISLFDLQGRLIRQQVISNGQPIDLHGLTAGMYWVKAVVGERACTGKVVKN